MSDEQTVTISRAEYERLKADRLDRDHALEAWRLTRNRAVRAEARQRAMEKCIEALKEFAAELDERTADACGLVPEWRRAHAALAWLEATKFGQNRDIR